MLHSLMAFQMGQIMLETVKGEGELGQSIYWYKMIK